MGVWLVVLYLICGFFYGFLGHALAWLGVVPVPEDLAAKLANLPRDRLALGGAVGLMNLAGVIGLVRLRRWAVWPISLGYLMVVADLVRLRQLGAIDTVYGPGTAQLFWPAIGAGALIVAYAWYLAWSGALASGGHPRRSPAGASGPVHRREPIEDPFSDRREETKP